MKRLKSIDEIYEEVRDCDLVVTNDVALETALNARIATPRIGTLAITPRHIAEFTGERILGRRFLTDLELISAVSEETGLKFRQVCSEILNIREIRRHTAEVRGNLAGRAAKSIYDSYSKMPTVENAMSATEPEDIEWYFKGNDGEDLKVAVVGVELFNDLDKHFVPDDPVFVDIFTDGDYEIDTIHVIGNDRRLAENAAELIDREHPDDFAVVLCSDRPIADAVRSSLYRRGIPFVNSMAVSDLAQIRDYLAFLDLSFDYRSLRVRDVAEIYSSYNGFVRHGTEGYLLCRQGPMMEGRALELYQVMVRVCDEGLTFGEVMGAVCNRRARPAVHSVLNQLGMEEETVTPERLANVRFAVENVQNLTHNEQIPDNERTGVLLADCKNSVFVDRPVVIYLGMDEDWTIPVAGRRYMDCEAETERNADRLAAILQQGQRRVYCVNRSKGGRDAAPSQTFDIITGSPIKDFASLCREVADGGWAVDAEERSDFTVPSMGEEDVEKAMSDYADVHPFSKTSFNAYAACPRMYMFNGLMPTEDNTSMEFGNLIHEFAELYACYPCVVRETGIDSFVDMVADRYAGISSPSMREIDRSRIRLAMENIMSFIDSLQLHLELKVPRDRNWFMKELGLDIGSDACETDYRSTMHSIHGKFDLFADGRVIDYKTGRIHDVDDINNMMNLDNIADHPEFQPMIYLALASEIGGSQAEFYQFYALGNEIESLKEDDYDLSNNVLRISIRQDGIDHFFSDEESIAAYRDVLRKDMKPHAEKVIKAVSESGVPSGAWPEDTDLVKRILDSIDDRKIKEDFVMTALNKLQKMFDGRTLGYGNQLLVSETALSEFLERLDGMHIGAMRGRYTDLPAKPRKGVNCRKCDYFEVCTRAGLTSDEGGDSDERPRRVPEGHRGDARRHDRRGRGPRNREDPHDSPEIREHRVKGRRAKRRPPADLHQKRGVRDGGQGEEAPRRRRRARREVQARPRPDVRRVLPVRRHGVRRRGGGVVRLQGEAHALGQAGGQRRSEPLVLQKIPRRLPQRQR